jgi:DNA gyrase subunit A
LDEGDVLRHCIFVNEDDEALIVSRSGKGLRFKVDTVRTMSRQAHGVKGLKLSGESDEIVGLVKVDTTKTALVITSKGKGKQVDYDLFTAHGRSTGGQRIYKLKEDEGEYIVRALSADAAKEDLMCITNYGQIIRMPVDTISQQGRGATGVRVFSMKKADDFIVSIAVLDKESDEETAQGEDQADATSSNPAADDQNIESADSSNDNQDSDN